MPKLKTDDIQIYYESYGQGEPIVFISGFNGDHMIWKQMAACLSNQYQTIVFDNRGAGQSDAPDAPYTVEMMAADTVSLCRTLGLDKCHFVGLSMGGCIAQTIALNYPEQVRSATLVNTFSKIDSGFKLFAQARLDCFQFPSLQEAMLKMGLSWSFSDEFLSQESTVNAIVEASSFNPYPMTETGYRHQLHALCSFNSTEWLNQINPRCLVIGSDRDKIVPEMHMQMLAHTIPNGQYHGFSKVGHMPHIEQPVLFEKVLRDFIQLT